MEDGNADIVTQDCLGGHHFNGNFNNVKALRAALANLPSPYDALVASDQKDVEAIYEGHFQPQGIHWTLRDLLWIRRLGLDLLAHGLQAAFGGI